MNKSLVIYILILCLVCALAKNLKRAENADEFQSFVQKFHKKYASEEEKQYRYSVFKDNLKHIEKLNQENHAVFGVNSFSDLSNEEFVSTYASVAASEHAASSLPKSNIKDGSEFITKTVGNERIYVIPTHVDQRDYTHRGVSSVKN